MRREVDLGRWLGSLPSGRAGCVFAEDVLDVRNALESTATSEPEPVRVVTLTWTDVPPLTNELGLLVSSLAQATSGFFPALYGLPPDRHARWTDSTIEAETREIMRRTPDVHGPACRKILSACAAGRTPQLSRLPAAEQAKQLALAIDPGRLVVIVAVPAPPSRSETVRSLAQGAEWLAANTGSRVALVLPTSLIERSELDHVTYVACVFVEPARASRPESEAPPPPTSPVAEPARSGHPAVWTSPILGRPAHHSDAEQHLSEHLRLDPELGPLFGYNLRVRTRFGTTPIVDVLWEEGRLAIEIDGTDHRGERQFSLDRQRDYQLTLSDYTVLRFTSGRVIEFVATVVEDIREAVRHVRKRKERV